jgi:hypothetical protein
MPATPQSSQRSDHREWWASTWFHSMNKSVWVLLKLLLQQLSQQSVIFLGGHPHMEINMQHQRWPLTGHGPGEVDDFQIAGPNRNGLIHIWYYMIPYIYMYIYIMLTKKMPRLKFSRTSRNSSWVPWVPHLFSELNGISKVLKFSGLSKGAPIVWACGISTSNSKGHQGTPEQSCYNLSWNGHLHWSLGLCTVVLEQSTNVHH